MPKRIYVGNLPGTTSVKEVEKLFSKYGEVGKVEINRDGTAVVSMKSGGEKAISALNQQSVGGRSLKVNEA